MPLMMGRGGTFNASAPYVDWDHPNPKFPVAWSNAGLYVSSREIPAEGYYHRLGIRLALSDDMQAPARRGSIPK